MVWPRSRSRKSSIFRRRESGRRRCPRRQPNKECRARIGLRDSPQVAVEATIQLARDVQAKARALDSVLRAGGRTIELVEDPFEVGASDPEPLVAHFVLDAVAPVARPGEGPIRADHGRIMDDACSLDGALLVAW